MCILKSRRRNQRRRFRGVRLFFHSHVLASDSAAIAHPKPPYGPSRASKVKTNLQFVVAIRDLT